MIELCPHTPEGVVLAIAGTIFLVGLVFGWTIGYLIGRDK